MTGGPTRAHATAIPAFECAHRTPFLFDRTARGGSLPSFPLAYSPHWPFFFSCFRLFWGPVRLQRPPSFLPSLLAVCLLRPLLAAAGCSCSVRFVGGASALLSAASSSVDVRPFAICRVCTSRPQHRNSSSCCCSRRRRRRSGQERGAGGARYFAA